MPLDPSHEANLVQLAEMQQTLKVLHEKRKRKLTDLRIAEKEIKVRFAAQGKLPADVLKQVADVSKSKAPTTEEVVKAIRIRDLKHAESHSRSQSLTMRIPEKETEARFAAPGKLPADALKRVSDVSKFKAPTTTASSAADEEQRLEYISQLLMEGKAGEELEEAIRIRHLDSVVAEGPGQNLSP
ncbi:hypothetical protein GALMADRAFT_597456 [Galerina marginata CBS 339.88]|uniref:Uncharacterized protein n=1 Tax=Galerina marginata (strain CBS 339.88) TaxID=685588 RepID=A0A067ST09_GALM3|nr:hypothetical protein GALMADRAFT_597456 [Galerina marginata CBS 339.88]